MPRSNTEYAEPFKVYRHDGDAFGRLKPAALLRYAQQVAMQNAWNAGLTDAVYEKTHTAYVLAKLALRFARQPRVDETLTLLTQPEKAFHAVNKRVTRVYDESGAEVALMDSRWVVIDTEKRAILRVHPPHFEDAWADKVDAELPMKMQRFAPEDCEPVGERTAVYSCCDLNGHLNNTRYVDMLFDALPLESLRGHTVRELLIFYHKEVPLGESFALYRKRTGEDTWYFLGQREGHACFEATLALEAEGGVPDAR